MDDLIQSGGIGGIGALFGALLAWAGFRERLAVGEDRAIQLEKDVVYKDTCTVCQKDSDHRFKDITDRLSRVETSIDKGFSDLSTLVKELAK
ncbi:MAG TPA: hypothetical protein VMW50_03575 [Dehalococcoidia bacterium]|nr:hypothetical protein [Dehalococcoidia bacterium]